MLSPDRWMVADEQLALHVESLECTSRVTSRWRRLRQESPDGRRRVDAQLARERAYDAETQRLLEEMRSLA